MTNLNYILSCWEGYHCYLPSNAFILLCSGIIVKYGSSINNSYKTKIAVTLDDISQTINVTISWDDFTRYSNKYLSSNTVICIAQIMVEIHINVKVKAVLIVHLKTKNILSTLNGNIFTNFVYSKILNIKEKTKLLFQSFCNIT